MKTLIFTLVCFVLSGITSINLAYGQEVQSIALTKKGELRIPAESDLGQSFRLDLSHMEFKTDLEMIEYIRTKSGDLHLMRAVPHEKAAILYLKANERPDWTDVEWNDYLKNQQQAEFNNKK